MESLNFLLFLLRPEIQKRLVQIGNVSVNPSETLHPYAPVDPLWVSSVLKKSRPFHLTTRERHYVIFNILVGEIWRGLLDNASPAQVLERAIHLERAYLQLSPRQTTA